MNSKRFLQCANCSQEPNNYFFVHKNRNPNVKKGKTENRSGYQNRKTGHQLSRKTDLKSDQNRKTEEPNVPLNKTTARQVGDPSDGFMTPCVKNLTGTLGQNI